MYVQHFLTVIFHDESLLPSKDGLIRLVKNSYVLATLNFDIINRFVAPYYYPGTEVSLKNSMYSEQNVLQ